MPDQFPHTGIFVTYEEVTGRRASMADAIRVLSRLNIHCVLQMVASLNATLIGPFESTSEIRRLQEILVRRLLTKELRGLIRLSNYGSDKSVVVFHRQQQLIMLRLALMACPTDSGRVWDSEAAWLFGEVCLMVNDLAGHREEELPDGDSLINLASKLLPIGEMPSDSQTASLVGRSYEMWLKIPNEPTSRSENDYIPIAARFYECYHLSLEHFVQGLFLILLKTDSFDPHAGNVLDALLINSKNYLQQVAFPQEVFQRILSIVSCKLSTLKDKVATEPLQNIRFDFTLQRRYPLIEVEPGIYLCHDTGFLRKFFTDGIYWQIHAALTVEEQPHFRSFFGKVFATYVENILNHVYQNGPNGLKHTVQPKLRFAGKHGEVCDYFVQNDDAWIIMEAKAAMLTTRGKYSGSGDVLEQELKGKFVRNQGNDKKGVGQLVNSIKKLWEGKPTTLRELQVQDCRRIYPVLVSYDSAIVSPGIPQYLEAQFQLLLKSEFTIEGVEIPEVPKEIRPLTVLSINDIETLTTLKGKHVITTVLATYHYYRAPAETLAGFLSRYPDYEINVTQSRFYANFLALRKDVQSYFDQA